MRQLRLMPCLFACLLLCASACSDDPEPELAENPLCAFDCPKLGVAEGNAAISGVQTADTLFRAVVQYATIADAASASLETELAQLRVDFGVGAKDPLGAQIRSQGEGALGKSPTIVAHVPPCWIDTFQVLDAQSQCSGEPPSGDTVPCFGPCRVEPGTDCSTAELQCTQNMVAGSCERDCSGTCTDAPDAAGGCEGVCLGTCDGACDKFIANGDGDLTCAGRCSGRCTGECARPIERSTCRGTCTGTCTLVNPKDGCDTAIEARCQAKSTRPFDCLGACDGTVELPPVGNAECRVAAQAQASYLAHCDAPRVSVVRAPAPAAENDREKRYLQALSNLEQRMPELLAAVARAELIKDAGQRLVTLTNTDVNKSFKSASEAENPPIKTSAGMTCALAEVPRVARAIETPEQRLNAALADANEVLGAFDID